MRSAEGFVAGTLVRVQTDSTKAIDNWKPIEQIKVGDMVLSKPELGVGEPVYKRVINTFEFENQESWYFSLSGFDNAGYTSSYMGVTPNHPFYVTGYCDIFVGSVDDYTPSESARWQCVDQLERGDVVVDAEGNRYMVYVARPLSAMKDSKLAWLQGCEYLDNPIGWRNEPNGISYDLSKLSWSGGGRGRSWR